ncbi:hypothetical protein ACFXDE_07960 [Kitasatospora sp. NPDC059408]
MVYARCGQAALALRRDAVTSRTAPPNSERMAAVADFSAADAFCIRGGR